MWQFVSPGIFFWGDIFWWQGEVTDREDIPAPEDNIGGHQVHGAQVGGSPAQAQVQTGQEDHCGHLEERRMQ